MRRFFLSTLTIAVFCLTLTAQNKNETIEGNGNLITRDVAVKSFETLQASGIYELKLTQGDKETVKVEADENLQDLFTVHNEGSKLVIEMEKLENKNLKTKHHLKVYVTFKKLKMLDLKTIGNVVAENKLAFENLELNNKSVGNIDLNLTANKLDIKNTSVGNVKLSGAAENAVVKNSGVGALQAGAFVVQKMNIENTGVGSAEVNAEKELKVKDSFLGKVKNKGAAPLHKLNKVVI